MLIHRQTRRGSAESFMNNIFAKVLMENQFSSAEYFDLNPAIKSCFCDAIISFKRPVKKPREVREKRKNLGLAIRHIGKNGFALFMNHQSSLSHLFPFFWDGIFDGSWFLTHCTFLLSSFTFGTTRNRFIVNAVVNNSFNRNPKCYSTLDSWLLTL